MYEVENLRLNTDKKYLSSIANFSALQDKTTLYINYIETQENKSSKDMIPLFYIDISSVEFLAELFFDYGNDVVKAGSKEILLDNEKKYRNYRLEQEIIAQIKYSNWKWYGNTSFIYTGKDISSDILRLEGLGIRLFTNEKKKLSVLNFSVTNSCYGIDWFELKGEVTAGGRKFNINDLVDFCKSKGNWTEYRGNILFIPTCLKRLQQCSCETDGNTLKISTDDIFDALEFVQRFDKNAIQDYSSLSNFQDIPLKLSTKLYDTLRSYQITGVKWLLSLRKNGFGGCLADDMGLGKTIQVIAYLSDESQKGTCALIVVPKTLIENWYREIEKFSPDLSTYIYHGAYRDFSAARNNRIIITTFGTLTNDIDILRKQKFDHLIIDEAQNIKNSKSKSYWAVSQIRATTKIIITGTPLENNISEYWGLMQIANPTKLTFKSLTAGLENAQIVENIRRLTKPFLLRRLKKDVLSDLPDKHEQTIYCNFDETQEQLYANMLESIRREIRRSPDRYEIKSNSIVLRGLVYLQEVCCHPRLLPIDYNVNHCVESAKTERLMSMLEELYQSGHKIVVFSRFTKMLEIINREISRQEFNVFYLDGNTKNRQVIIDEFEASRDGIFLISLKAGGVGINLVSADSVIIYDPWWNPAAEKQAEDRVYRIGQKNKVTVYKLIATNTIEEKILLLQEQKRKLFDDVISGHSVPQNITMEDIRILLES